MNFRHLPYLIISLVILLITSNSFANNWRTPQNYVPDTDFFAVYVEDSFSEDMWKNDHANALKNLSIEVNSWESRQEYLSNYGLKEYESSPALTTDQKRRRIEKGMLRYLDKRLMTKINNAPKTSSLASVKNARTALRPASTTEISENFKLKINGRLLQGRGTISLLNPWIDANAQFSLSGRLEFNLERQFVDSEITTQIKIDVKSNEWLALMQKDITDNFKAQILSIQPTNSMAFDHDADRRIQLIYNKNF